MRGIPQEVLRETSSLSEDQRWRAIHEFYRRDPPTICPLGEEMIDFVGGLAGKRPDGSFVSSGDAYTIRKKLLKAAKVPKGFGVCKVCEGHAVDPAVREVWEAWKSEDPPTGPGYQLWSTTGEGCPVSPVFATLDELCAWCETHATTFASYTATAAQWKRMLDEDFVHAEDRGTDPDGNPVTLLFL